MPDKRSWYRISASADQPEVELYIYGNIGDSWYADESVTAKQVIDELNALDIDYLTVRINSVGGSVADGLAIYNAIKRHRAAVTVEIDAVAYSMASLIAMAGDTVRMSSNAMLMIHAPWMSVAGNADELRRAAEVLDKFADAMLTSYLRDGVDAATVEGWLKDGGDHYLTAAEAKAAGLIDEITDAVDLAAALRDVPVDRYHNPAAAAAKHKEHQAMPKQNKAAGQPAAPDNTPNEPDNVVAIEQAAQERALAAERERRQAIRAAAKPFMQREDIRALIDEHLDDPQMSVERSRELLLAKLGEGAEPVNTPTATPGVDARDKFREGAVQAIAIRAGLAKDDDHGNEFRGLTLRELARASLDRAGISIVGMGPMDIVGAAFTHSTSDFGSLLADVAHKAMLKGYDEAEETFQAWTNRGTATSFKPERRVDLNSFPTLDSVPEGGEYNYGTVGDRGETVVLATYGKLFSITRQAIINDDLGAFTRIPARMGRAAIRTVGDLVYAILTANPAMSDGTALFHANHNNLLAAGGITTAAVDAMRVAMAKQKDSTAKGAHALNIRLANLIVPMALEGAAKVVRDSEFEVGSTAKNNTVPNSVRGTFEVISDARLDAASATAWYGAANPASHDVIEVTYLDGNDRPYMEQRTGWTVDGAEFKVRIDAAATPLDFRTLAKNPG